MPSPYFAYQGNKRMVFLESQEGFAEKNQIADASVFYNIDFSKARQKKLCLFNCLETLTSFRDYHRDF